MVIDPTSTNPAISRSMYRCTPREAITHHTNLDSILPSIPLIKALLLGALAGCVAAGGSAPTRLRLEYIEEFRAAYKLKKVDCWGLWICC
jgi:hypothetical protein